MKKHCLFGDQQQIGASWGNADLSTLKTTVLIILAAVGSLIFAL